MPQAPEKGGSTMDIGYSAHEVLEYLQAEDVKFVRLAFCDVFGRQKNISVMPGEMPRAFSTGIAFDASAIAGFGGRVRSDLFLHPDPSTLTLLPWRPEHGRVVRMFCDICYPDGTPFENDARAVLKKAVADAAAMDVRFSFGAEMEFYLFRQDENGRPTKIPYDEAGYMDIAPDDRGENVRREVCLTLERMGILPESSHHEEGPGQNEIDFRYADALTAADDAVTFRDVVRTVADRNGLWADFSAKPLPDAPGNGFHINISARHDGMPNDEVQAHLIAGILDKIAEITAFLDPAEDSYLRLGREKAPRYISWSRENRSQLIRVPAAEGAYVRAELRSPDAQADPYLAFALLIYAGLHGIRERLPLPQPVDADLFSDAEAARTLRALPADLAAARALARDGFAARCLPPDIVRAYCG